MTNSSPNSHSHYWEHPSSSWKSSGDAAKGIKMIVLRNRLAVVIEVGVMLGMLCLCGQQIYAQQQEIASLRAQVRDTVSDRVTLVDR